MSLVTLEEIYASRMPHLYISKHPLKARMTDPSPCKRPCQNRQWMTFLIYITQPDWETQYSNLYFFTVRWMDQRIYILHITRLMHFSANTHPSNCETVTHKLNFWSNLLLRICPCLAQVLNSKQVSIYSISTYILYNTEIFNFCEWEREIIVTNTSMKSNHV